MAGRIPSQPRVIQRILVALDGSRTGEGALPHVVALARAFGAQVLLVSVIEPGPGDRATIDSVEWRLARASARAYLDKVIARLEEAGIHADSALAEGRASEQILRLAEDRDADLLALCSHGRGGVTEFNLSGTVSKVVQAAACSVFVARARPPAEADGPAAYKRVLVPVDCTTRSQWAVNLAASVARAQGAELVLGTVIVHPEVLGDSAARAAASQLAQSLLRLNRKVARHCLNQLASEIAGEGLVVHQRVVEGDHVGRSLTRLAETEGCDMIVLSAHGTAPDTGWPFGSVPGLLLQHATTPVLVLQDVAWRRRLDSVPAAEQSASHIPPR